MCKFIKLNQISAGYIYVNVNQIIAIAPNIVDGYVRGAKIKLNGEIITVTESPDKVIELSTKS